MTQKQFMFIVDPGQLKTIRERELQDAEKRSHAAKTASLQRRARPKAKGAIHIRPKNDASAAQVEHDQSARSTPQRLSGDEPSTLTQVDSTAELKILSRCMQGNSDPFAAYPVHITPRLNQALSFMRDAVYPGLYFTHYFQRIFIDKSLQDRNASVPARFAKQGLEFATSSLEDEGTALACIASHMQILASYLQPSEHFNATHLTIALTSKSSRILHSKLVRSKDTQVVRDKNLINHIYWLYRTSIYQDDEKAIEIHGATLIRAITEGYLKGDVSPIVCFQVASLDLFMCAQYLRRPLFDYAWFGKAFGKFWLEVEARMPRVPAKIFDDLDSTVRNQELRRLFLQVRHGVDYSNYPRLLSSWSSPSQQLEAYQWLVTKGLHGLGLNMTLYHDLKELGNEFIEPSPEDQIQAALALGLIYYRRTVGHAVTINGVNFHDAFRSIMSALRAILEPLLRWSVATAHFEYEHAYLWLLFAGAYHERRCILHHGEHESSWFQCQLEIWTKLAGIDNWDDLLPVLQRFVYCHWLEPNGSMWFEQLLQEPASAA